MAIDDTRSQINLLNDAEKQLSAIERALGQVTAAYLALVADYDAAIADNTTPGDDVARIQELVDEADAKISEQLSSHGGG